ncbi:hypothetical protein P8935_06310 [Telmatobacter sp. DSM 110680]|uniref:Uncharacterized protein n=1 Tax=Telmatobacter sp. DSM 110680 TaxID=3036704 RepID=A0AAU7DMP2_9BACT
MVRGLDRWGKRIYDGVRAIKTSSLRRCGGAEHAARDERLYTERTNGFCTRGSAPGNAA